MTITYQEENSGLIIKIMTDDSAENPRAAHDNVCTMVGLATDTALCFGPNTGRMFGDEGAWDKAVKDIRASANYSRAWEQFDSENYVDLYDPDGLMEALQRCQDIVSVPIFSFAAHYLDPQHPRNNDRILCLTTGNGDEKLTGVMYMTEDQVISTTGSGLFNPRVINEVNQIMATELEIYAVYLCGHVYGYTVEDADAKVIESCGGFYGNVDYILAHARDAVRAYAQMHAAPTLKIME